MNTHSVTPDRRTVEAQRMERNQCIACGAPLPSDSLELECLRHQSPLALLIEEDSDGTWAVWLGLPGENPVTSPYGFCCGTGRSREEALLRSEAALQRALGAMQRGDVEQWMRPGVA